MIAAFGWLTLQMLINLLNEYKRDKITTTATFEFPEVISLPVSTACIQFSLSRPCSSYIHGNFTNYFKRVNGSKETFLDREVCWSNVVTTIVYYYLAFLADNEARKATDLIGSRTHLQK